MAKRKSKSAKKRRKGRISRLFGWRKARSKPWLSYPSVTDYYKQNLFVPDASCVMHPTNEDWFKSQVIRLCSKRLSTGSTQLLEEVYQMTTDPFARGLLAKKIHSLHAQMLDSYKEHSDRALIMRTETGDLATKWQAIYILGSFGGDLAVKHLESKKDDEQNDLIRHAMQQAILRIRRNLENKKKKRGF